MTKQRYLNSKERKRIHELLKKQYGFEDTLDYFFLINDKNRLYIMNKEITDINIDTLKTNTIGLYFGEQQENQIRLSIEGSQLVGPKATKNILEIQDSHAWMKGEEIDITETTNIENPKLYIIIKSGSDFLGSGKIRDKRVLNYVSKTRRIN